METAQRQSDSALVEELLRHPGSFEFFRAVEILEQHVGREVGADRGGAAGSGREVRFRVEPTLGFAAAPVLQVARDRQVYCLALSFIGLIGSSGTMPVHYTETLLQRRQLKDSALQTFLDALQDRTAALYYGAWKKYRHAVMQRTTNREAGRADPILEIFLGLVGRLPRQRDKAIGIDEWTEAHHAGLFSDRRRSARGLKAMLEGLLRCTVRVDQFVGQWIELDDDALSRLGDREAPGNPARLGEEAILGTHVWSIDSRIRIVAGPLNRTHFRRLWPGGEEVHYIRSAIRTYVGPLIDFELEWELESDAPSPLLLGGGQLLGRDCWLGWGDSSSPDRRVHSPLWARPEDYTGDTETASNLGYAS